MKVFLTGGTGFLGQRVIARLKKDGHSILALSRNSRPIVGCETITGTFQNIPDWESHLTGIDAVIHCAAPIEVWGKWVDFERDIVIASKSLLDAANRQNVKRFIYISSESVLQDKAPLVDIDETLPYPSTPNSMYGRAKKLAEIAINSVQGGATRIILRPTFIWGKGVKALETMAGKVKSGDFMWINQGESLMEMVHVENVVEAIALSLTKGQDKGIYFVTDENAMPAKKFLTSLLGAIGVQPGEKNMPGTLATIAASSVEGIWKLFGIAKAPPLTRFELAFVSQPRRYKIEKIKNELGYKPVVNFERGLAEMHG